jgi:hypothetical protein
VKVIIGPYDDSGYRQRKEIEIHPYDTWSMDHTLAEIVLPMLKQLKETSQGYHRVEDEDVPHLSKQQWIKNESMQYDMFASEETDQLKWDNGDARWNWVLDEMIYAFDCKVNKDDVYMRFEDVREARREQERISNGFRLFGKYYEGLWT